MAVAFVDNDAAAVGVFVGEFAHKLGRELNGQDGLELQRAILVVFPVAAVAANVQVGVRHAGLAGGHGDAAQEAAGRAKGQRPGMQVDDRRGLGRSLAHLLLERFEGERGGLVELVGAAGAQGIGHRGIGCGPRLGSLRRGLRGFRNYDLSAFVGNDYIGHNSSFSGLSRG